MSVLEFEKQLQNIGEPPKSVGKGSDVLTFEIVNRTINMFIELVDILVEGDSNSRQITFKVPRYFDGVDLSLKDISVNYLNALNKSKESPAKNVFVNVDTFSFDWIVPGEATVENGTLKISVAFTETNTSDEKIYIWQTKPAELNVEECFAVFNDATLPDYSYQKYFYDLNSNDTVYDEIIDDDAPIAVIGRRILMPTLEDFIVSKDTLSQVVSFRLPRYFDNVDLSKRVIAIKFINAAGGGDRSKAINVIVSGDNIIFGWLIDGNVTVKSGYVQFAIEFLGYTEKSEFYCWQTVPAQLFVTAGLNVDSMMLPPTPSWVQSWELETDKLIKKMQSQVDDSKLSATNAKVSEVAAKLSETNSKNSENQSLEQTKIAIESAKLASGKSIEASDSAKAASLSETNAKESEHKSKQSETNAKLSEDVTVEKSIEATDSANLAVSEANRALGFANIADEKAASAHDSATLSQRESEKAIIASNTASDMATTASESMITANEAKGTAISEANRAKTEADRAKLISDNIHDIYEFALYSELPRPGVSEKIYTIYGDIDTVNGMYRWDGVDYEVISSASQVAVDNQTIINKDSALSAVAVIENNVNSVNKFWVGIKEHFDAIEKKSDDTTYVVTDDVGSGGAEVVVWKDIVEKPTVFPPDEHNHDQTYPTIDSVDTMQKEILANTNARHEHNNKSIIDGITAALVSTWNTAAAHISDVVKHVAASERTLWNTVSSKANQTEVDAALISLNENKADKPSLLINWNFSIWQAGNDFTFSGGKKYGPDGWYTHTACKITKTNNGVKVTKTGNFNAIVWLAQSLENSIPKLTTTAKIRKSRPELQLRINRTLSKNTTDWQTLTAKNDDVVKDVEVITDGTVNDGDWIEISYICASEGDHIAELPYFDPAFELLRCQRYYLPITSDVLGNGYVTGDGALTLIQIPLPIAMRITPTIALSSGSSMEVRGYEASSLGTNLAIYANGRNSITIVAKVAGIAPKTPVSSFVNGTIAFDARL